MSFIKKDLKVLFDLYFTFLKIGGFTLGSGYAMIPLIEKETVYQKKWLSKEEFDNYIVLAQSVPGMISINTATAIGRNVAGVCGAIVSTLGMITLPFLIIITIAKFFWGFRESQFVYSAFNGIQIATIIMITMSFLSLYKSGVKDKFQFTVFILTLIALLFFHVSPAYIILVSSVPILFYKTLLHK